MDLPVPSFVFHSSLFTNMGKNAHISADPIIGTALIASGSE